MLGSSKDPTTLSVLASTVESDISSQVLREAPAPKDGNHDKDANTGAFATDDGSIGPEGIVVVSMDGINRAVPDEEINTAGNGDKDDDDSVVRSSRKRKRDTNAGVDDGADSGISNTPNTISDFEFGYLKIDQTVPYEGGNDSVSTFNHHSEIHKCLMDILNAKYDIATLEFQLSMEMILRYTQYSQPFWQFLLMCESIAVEFAEKKINDDPTKDFQVMLNFASSQLDNISWNMMTFIKRYVSSASSLLETRNILQNVFSSVNGQLLDKYSRILSVNTVSKAISRISREDLLFQKMTRSKSLKDARLELMSALATNFCRDKRSFLESNNKTIKDDIKRVLKNIHSLNSKVNKPLIKEVQELLVTYVSDDVDENPFPRLENGSGFLVHSRNLRPKETVDYTKSFNSSGSVKAVQSKAKAVVVGAKEQTNNIQPSTVQSKPKAGVVGAKDQTRNIQPSAVQSKPKAVVEATKELTTNIEPSTAVQSRPNAGIIGAKDQTRNIQPSAAVQCKPKAVVEATMELTTNIEPSSAVQGTQDQLQFDDIPSSRMEITSNKDPTALTIDNSAFLILVTTNLETLSNFSKNTVLGAQEVTEAASHHLQYLIQLCETNDVNFDEIVENAKLQRCSTTQHALPEEPLNTVGNAENTAMEVDNNMIFLDGVDQTLDMENDKADELKDNIEERGVQIVDSADRNIFKSCEDILHGYFQFATNSDKDDNRLFHSKIRIITVTKREDWLCSCVLSMFAHALRIHLMTTSLLHFDRTTHEFVYKCLSDNRTLVSVWRLLGHGTFTPYAGIRRLSLIIDYLLGNHYRDANIQLNFLQSSTVIMRSTSNNSLTADSIDFNQMIADKILESLDAESSIDIDPTLIFIDIVTPAVPADNSTQYLSFPNRIMIKGPVTSVVYQSVAALYKCIISGNDQYMFRIITRHSRNFGTSYVMLNLSYDELYDQTIAEYPFELLEISKASKTFPAVLKLNRKSYYLEGIILCLNKGQLILPTEYSAEACLRASTKNNIISEDQLVTKLLYSLSDAEIVGSYDGRNKIRIEEMQILNSESRWFTDEILNVALTRVISWSSPSCGMFVRSDVVADVFVFRQLVHAVANNSDSFVESEANIDPLRSLEIAYEESKSIWAYQNIFMLDSWFHTIINYPENSHWIFVGINAKRKIIFIVNSMWKISVSQIILNAVKVYIRFEHTSCTLTQDPIIGDFDDWSIHNTGQSPQQLDSNNCGVHAFLAFLSLFFQTGDNENDNSTPIKFEWSTTKDNIKEYRSLISDLFFDETILSALNRLQEILLMMPESDSRRRKRRK